MNSRGSSTVEHAICNGEVAGSAPAPGTILSGHQPVFLPGLVFFNKVALSEAFMWVGHCQLQNKSWHTRNYIRQGGDKLMLSIPVERNFGQSIDETKVLDGVWRHKHLSSIEQAYQGRPFFKDYFPALKQLIEWPSFTGLGEMNKAICETMFDWFDIETDILDSRDFSITGAKNDMLISMCGGAQYPDYLSNEGSRAYVDEEYLKFHGVTHHWQKFQHPIYDQGRPFIPNLSAIDLLFNCGPESGRIIRGAGHVS